MKTLTRTLLATLIIAAFGMNASGQDNPSDEITARAEVRPDLVVNGAQDLEFSNVLINQPKTVNTRNQVTEGTFSGNEQSGRFDITKGAETDVRVEFTSLPDNLQKNGDGATLPISFDDGELGRLNLTIGNEDGIIFNPTSAINTPNSGETIPYFLASGFSVYLGGTVTPAEEQTVGTYEADVTLTVSYN